MPDWRCKGHTVSLLSGTHTDCTRVHAACHLMAVTVSQLCVLGACHDASDALQQLSDAVHGLLGMQVDRSSNNLVVESQERQQPSELQDCMYVRGCLQLQGP